LIPGSIQTAFQANPPTKAAYSSQARGQLAVAYAQSPAEMAHMERVNPQKGPGRPAILKKGHSNRISQLMGTKKEISKGMPVVSAKTSRIWDMGFRIWDFGLVVLAVLLIIFSCLDTRYWPIATRHFMVHGPGHQPPLSQGHDYGPAGKARLLNKQFFLNELPRRKQRVINRNIFF